MSGPAAHPLERPGLTGGVASVPDLSVVVVLDEFTEPLPDLYREYAPVLRSSGRVFEFIFIAAQPRWHFLDALGPLIAQGEPIRVFQVGQSFGEAGLLKAATEFCRGSVVLNLSSNRRVKAASLPDLIARIEGGADVAVAYRGPQRDSWIHRLQRRTSQVISRAAVGADLNDLGCGVRAIRRSVLANLPLYGDSARYLPIVALREGFAVEEVPVERFQADSGPPIYPPGVYIRRLIDIVGLFFLIRFREKPLRFFGLLGVGFSSLGVMVLAVMSVQRMGGRAMADRPLLLLGMMFVVLGIQVFSLGLIGEIIVHFQIRHRPTYRVRERAREKS